MLGGLVAFCIDKLTPLVDNFWLARMLQTPSRSMMMICTAPLRTKVFDCAGLRGAAHEPSIISDPRAAWDVR